MTDDDGPDGDWVLPPTPAELIVAEGRWLWFACYALLVHSGILETGGTPRRTIPNTPGKLVDYAEELLAFVRKTKRDTRDRVPGDIAAVERRVAMVKWILAGCPVDDDPTGATPSQE